MEFYSSLFKFSFLEEFAYPVEILAFTIRKLINFGFLILFWYVLSSTNPELFTFRQIIAYYLISEAVQDLTFTTNNRFGRLLQYKIKNGNLSNYLIKPIHTLRFLYVEFMGRRTSSSIYALVTFFIGIVIFPPQSVLNILLFIVALFLTAATGAGINVLLGVIGFYSPEAGSIRSVFVHVSKMLSGALIPLNYFPETLRNLITYTPFPILSYFPTSILQQGSITSETFLKLGLSLFWGITLLLIANILWKKALKNYDGVGI